MIKIMFLIKIWNSYKVFPLWFCVYLIDSCNFIHTFVKTTIFRAVDFWNVGEVNALGFFGFTNSSIHDIYWGIFWHTNSKAIFLGKMLRLDLIEKIWRLNENTLQLVLRRLLRDDVLLFFLTGSVNVDVTCLVELGFVLLMIIGEELLDQDVQIFQLFEDQCDVQLFFQSFRAEFI